MPLAIRRATQVDARDISQIYVESSASGFGDLMPPPTLDEAQIDRWVAELGQSGPAQWWVAEIDGAIDGFVGITPSRDPVEDGLGELDTIAVDPTHWRAGVGSALMAIAVDGLARAGYRRAILWTVAEYVRGQAFYWSQGWRRDDAATRDHGRQVAFRRELPPPDQAVS